MHRIELDITLFYLVKQLFYQRSSTMNAEQVFKALDKDGSGSISPNELKAFRMKLSIAEVEALMCKVT